jgi:hypothetical protein
MDYKQNKFFEYKAVLVVRRKNFDEKVRLIKEMQKLQRCWKREELQRKLVEAAKTAHKDD